MARSSEYQLPSFRAMASDASEGAKKNVGGGAKNKLAFQKSPYLLQHAQNPVDWYVGSSVKLKLLMNS